MWQISIALSECEISDKLSALSFYMNAGDKQQSLVSVDVFFLAVVWLLFVFGLALANWHSTWRPAFIVGLPCAAIPTVLILCIPKALITRLTVGGSLMVFSGLFIHQSHGMIEIHFGIFVLLAILLCYEDWRIIVVAAGVIAIHHFTVNYLQQQGYAIECLAVPSFRVILIHAAYVIVDAAALSYLAIKLHSQTALAERSQAELKIQVEAMCKVVDEASVGVDAVAAISREMARSSQSIANGAQEQAASLEQTAASLEEITATIRQSSENASEARHLTKSSGESARQGGESVSNAMTAMVNINTSSERISEMVSTIDEVAFQTNLLAVNAAIEAALAGDEGRSFAVVAEEIRALSQRTSGAARTIREIIRESSSRIETGTRLVTLSSETLSSIVHSAERVRHVVTDIATALGEQTAGIEQINTAMSQMDQVTQNNAEQTEQLAATAHSLAQHSEKLQVLLSTLVQSR